MHVVTILTQLIFPSPYTQKKIRTLSSAPSPADPNIFSLYDYHKPEGKKLIYSIKQKRDRYLEYLISQEMRYRLLAELAEQSQYSYFLDPVIISIPLHKQQLHKRGFNQSSGYAKELAHILKGRYIKNLLYKNKSTQKQALLKTKSERMKNVEGCFSLNEKYRTYVKNKDIIIVDDLVTTGATILECKKVLLKNGARNVIGITIAH